MFCNKSYISVKSCVNNLDILAMFIYTQYIIFSHTVVKQYTYLFLILQVITSLRHNELGPKFRSMWIYDA